MVEITFGFTRKDKTSHEHRTADRLATPALKADEVYVIINKKVYAVVAQILCQ